jgi:GH25 family lysozyme M1 (1,4-beta-N-acetylmuramidase)
MAAYWVPVENMGKAIVNGEVTMANAKEKTEAFNDSLKAQK